MWRTSEAYLLTPVAKAFSTDVGIEVSSLGVQVHGGMGYIEETGAAQHHARRAHRRDLRRHQRHPGDRPRHPQDRAIRRQGGGAQLAGFRETARRLATLKDAAFGAIAPRLSEAIDALERATAHLQTALGKKPNDALAGATPYTRLFGLVAGAAYLAEAAQASRRSMATGNDDPAHLARIAIARYLRREHLPQAGGLERIVVSGAESVMQSDFVLSA